LGAQLHAKHPYLKRPSQKKKKEGKAKGDAKDPNAIKGATTLNKGDEPRR
jgi:hypothetical protein